MWCVGYVVFGGGGMLWLIEVIGGGYVLLVCKCW